MRQASFDFSPISITYADRFVEIVHNGDPVQLWRPLTVRLRNFSKTTNPSPRPAPPAPRRPRIEAYVDAFFFFGMGFRNLCASGGFVVSLPAPGRPLRPARVAAFIE